MAKDIVPIELGLPEGYVTTLWAPSWREDNDDWEAFLGLGEDLEAALAEIRGAAVPVTTIALVERLCCGCPSAVETAVEPIGRPLSFRWSGLSII